MSAPFVIVRIVYNILFAIFFVLSSPFYFFKMQRRGRAQMKERNFNWMEGFKQRFAQYDPSLEKALANHRTLWLHAVSVGEVNVCTQVIKALEPRVPDLKIVVSTTTTTGMERLRNLPSHITRIYYPLDFGPWTSRALDTIHPDAIVLVEAEIWPNFLWEAADRNIPLFLINARLSERSFPRYKKGGFVFRKIFGSFAGVAVQNDLDAARLEELGCRPEAIQAVGSLKYDAAMPDNRRTLDIPRMLGQLGVPTGARIIVGGSTHDGEETILAEQFLRLKQKFPDLFLVLVPRHFEFAREVGKRLEAMGVKFAYRSEIDRTQYTPGKIECLLVNSTGELKYFYEQATVVFVGKSLTASGGQNPIEPAAFGKPVVVGPNMSEFAGIVRTFLEGDGLIQVQDAQELESTIEMLLEDPVRRDELGRNALSVVHQNLGAIDRTVEMIAQCLKARSARQAREAVPIVQILPNY